MSWLYNRMALGADWEAGQLRMVIVGRRFNRYYVLDRFHREGPLAEGLEEKLVGWLRKWRSEEIPITVCLPREDLIVRFLDLPLEAEKQLRKVVAYQVDTLHPFPAGEVYWDCAVVARDGQAKQIRVMVVLVEKSRLEKHRVFLQDLGLRVNSLSLAAACFVPWWAPTLPESALVVFGRAEGLELLAFHRQSLCADRELPLDPAESLRERFEREMHALRSVVPVSDPTTLPVFGCGPLPAGLIEEAVPLPTPKVRLQVPPDFDPVTCLGPLAAAYAGLNRKAAPRINLVPDHLRPRSVGWLRIPTYALGATAVLLGSLLATQGWIQTRLYARTLERQIARLESAATAALHQNQQVEELASRVALLEAVRQKTWQKLQILQELARVLPEGAWVQELEIKDGTIEVYGYADRAAELVQALEASPLFAQVEFTAPLTRDAQNKEVFRMRMRLEAPG